MDVKATIARPSQLMSGMLERWRLKRGAELIAHRLRDSNQLFRPPSWSTADGTVRASRRSIRPFEIRTTIVLQLYFPLG